MGMLMLRETARLVFWLHTPALAARLQRREIRRVERAIGADARKAKAEAKRSRRRERNQRISTPDIGTPQAA